MIQDQYADLANLLQNLSVATLAIGESGLQLIRYGAGEARITGALRMDGIVRALGGLYAGAFTTTARNALTQAQRPYGLIILNTTTNQYEWNSGTDVAPVWVPFGGSVAQGTLGARPAAGPTNTNTFYLATDDNGGTLYHSNGSAWTKLAPGITQAPQAHAASHHPSSGSDKHVMGLFGTLASRPTASTVSDGAIYYATDNGIVYQEQVDAWVKIATKDYADLDDPPPTDGAAGTGSLRTLGATSTQAAAGNDGRFTDQRVPTNGSVVDAKHGDDSPIVIATTIVGAGAARRGKAIGLRQPDGVGTHEILGLYYDNTLGKWVSNPFGPVNILKTAYVRDEGAGPIEVGETGGEYQPASFFPSAGFHDMGLQLQLKYTVYGALNMTGAAPPTRNWHAWLYYSNDGGGINAVNLGALMGADQTLSVQVSPWIDVPVAYTEYEVVAPRLGFNIAGGTGAYSTTVYAASCMCRWISD